MAMMQKANEIVSSNPVVVFSKTNLSTPIMSLPDDLLLSCFARISRWYYPSLSLVSKKFRSLIASPELYKKRSILGRTESCLYVCLKFHPQPNPSWFTLCQKPNRALTNDTMKKKKKKKEKLSVNFLVPISIPIPHPLQAHWAGVVAVGSSIYVIGGPIKDPPSSSVSVLDCQSHTWRKAPSMRVERDYPAANVFDGKIYVAGGCKDCDSSNWMEVFDPKTQTWEHVLSPFAERCNSRVQKSAEFEGRIYFMFGKEGVVAYTPKEDRWEVVEMNWLDSGWAWVSYCVINNVLYSCSNADGLKWYDSKRQCWMKLKGLKGLSKFSSYGCVKLADYGGKLAVLWNKYLRSSGYRDMRLWCAVMVLERRNNDEIWGEVEWLDNVLTVPNSFQFECALAATV